MGRDRPVRTCRGKRELACSRVSEVLIRQAEFVPLDGGFIAVQPRKVEHAVVSSHRVAESLTQDAALLHGAWAVVLEFAGVEFANSQPVGAIVLEGWLDAPIQPDDTKPRPRRSRGEGDAADDACEVPPKFALDGRSSKSVVIRTQLRVRQRVRVVVPCHASDYRKPSAAGVEAARSCRDPLVPMSARWTTCRSRCIRRRRTPSFGPRLSVCEVTVLCS